MKRMQFGHVSVFKKREGERGAARGGRSTDKEERGASTAPSGGRKKSHRHLQKEREKEGGLQLLNLGQKLPGGEKE